MTLQCSTVLGIFLAHIFYTKFASIFYPAFLSTSQASAPPLAYNVFRGSRPPAATNFASFLWPYPSFPRILREAINRWEVLRNIGNSWGLERWAKFKREKKASRIKMWKPIEAVREAGQGKDWKEIKEWEAKQRPAKISFHNTEPGMLGSQLTGMSPLCNSQHSLCLILYGHNL